MAAVRAATAVPPASMAIGTNLMVSFLVVERHWCVRVGDFTSTANIPSGINSPFGDSSPDGFGDELTEPHGSSVVRRADTAPSRGGRADQLGQLCLGCARHSRRLAPGRGSTLELRPVPHSATPARARSRVPGHPTSGVLSDARRREAKQTAHLPGGPLVY